MNERKSDGIKLSDFLQDADELWLIMSGLHRESDRGMTLIATSFLDELLTQILRAFFIQGPASEALLKGFNAPLGTFSSRIAAAAALGLVNDHEYRELHVLRKIRNVFAHQVHVSFADRSVKDLCRNLFFGSDRRLREDFDARRDFSISATAMMTSLMGRSTYVTKKRLKFGEWLEE